MGGMCRRGGVCALEGRDAVSALRGSKKKKNQVSNRALRKKNKTHLPPTPTKILSDACPPAPARPPTPPGRGPAHPPPSPARRPAAGACCRGVWKSVGECASSAIQPPPLLPSHPTPRPSFPPRRPPPAPPGPTTPLPPPSLLPRLPLLPLPRPTRPPSSPSCAPGPPPTRRGTTRSGWRLTTGATRTPCA